ncbi:MBL fold metallo-hydrolase [Oceaniglobus roseus]|uniref:MBL fold metallo-hydrolase n=1 Tax=Oceaniglobus roseus TaxID=1737570 RepID=UPI000C7EDB1D|nr:MBL fold metallo-hydrolase [Kandeliimicrobium roseum]
MLTFGDARIDKIVDLDPFVLPASLIFPGRRLKELAGEDALLSPHHVDFAADAVILSLHSFLLRLDGKTVLVDTCVGECKPRPRRTDWHDRRATGYLDRLAAAGVRPEDVDVVMCTHLHADHVGWNTRLQDGRWVPTFPNARYVMGRDELAHWEREEAANPGGHNHGAFADSVLPVFASGQVERVEDGFALTPRLSVVPLRGHSPGHAGLELDGGRHGRAVFCGDAIHSPVQVFRPDWSSGFCHDPDRAAATRRALLERAADEDLLLLPAHTRLAHGFRVRAGATGFRPAMV